MKYTVWFTSGASTLVKVEADDPEEAIEKAYDEVYVSLCHQCAHDVDLSDEWEVDVVFDTDGNTVYEEPRR